MRTARRRFEREPSLSVFSTRKETFSETFALRLPDFTASFEGDVYYWEHLGMLSMPSYREAWERKRQWYEDNGYANRLITSEDGPNGSIDAVLIEQTAQQRILKK